MVSEISQLIKKSVYAASVILLAALYVLTYRDYLTTVSMGEQVSISTFEPRHK